MNNLGLNPELDAALMREALREGRTLALWAMLAVFDYVCICVSAAGLLPW